MWFWKPWSPRVCSLQAGEPGKTMVWLSSSPMACAPGEPMDGVNLIPRAWELGVRVGVGAMACIPQIPFWTWTPAKQEHQGQKAVEDRCLSSSREGEFPLPHPFLFKPSADWMMSTHTVEVNLLYLVYWYRYWSLLETRTHKNNVLLLVWDPLAQSGRHIKLSCVQGCGGMASGKVKLYSWFGKQFGHSLKC